MSGFSWITLPTNGSRLIRIIRSKSQKEYIIIKFLREEGVNEMLVLPQPDSIILVDNTYLSNLWVHARIGTYYHSSIYHITKILYIAFASVDIFYFLRVPRVRARIYTSTNSCNSPSEKMFYRVMFLVCKVLCISFLHTKGLLNRLKMRTLSIYCYWDEWIWNSLIIFFYLEKRILIWLWSIARQEKYF